MKDSLQQRLAQIAGRFEEIGMLLSQPEVMADQNQFRTLSQEYAQLDPLVSTWHARRAAQKTCESAQEILADAADDAEMASMAREELAESEAELARLDAELKLLLLPRDPDDDKNIFIEVRAGTGGDEAALFAADLFRMYAKYAETQGWKLELMSATSSDLGGYREVVARVEGKGAFAHMKYESGTHRVQRVPETESQGRIHTSACTVAILAEQDNVDEINIAPGDLRIDTFRASGAGGQHVNTTDSAIRITHLPSGLVVECQDERSQHKNKARAMSLLQSRLLEAEQSRQAQEQAEDRRLQVGSGDRSQRIRTYNFPQGRVTDHRIGLTVYKLDDVLAGNLDLLVGPLRQEQQARLLAETENQ